MPSPFITSQGLCIWTSRDRSIHTQSRIPFVFEEDRVTRASMPKAEFHSCSRRIG